MFSEGGCGNGEIANMIDLFNLVCPTLAKLEKDIIWYEYGQIMGKIYQWTNYLEDLESTEPDHRFYDRFNQFMKKYYTDMHFKPSKVYVSGE